MNMAKLVNMLSMKLWGSLGLRGDKEQGQPIRASEARKSKTRQNKNKTIYNNKKRASEAELEERGKVPSTWPVLYVLFNKCYKEYTMLEFGH